MQERCTCLQEPGKPMAGGSRGPPAGWATRKSPCAPLWTQSVSKNPRWPAGRPRRTQTCRFP